jgi:hypothetical protein
VAVLSSGEAGGFYAKGHLVNVYTTQSPCSTRNSDNPNNHSSYMHRSALNARFRAIHHNLRHIGIINLIK